MVVAPAESDPYYLCLCGLSVYKGSFYIAIIGIISNGLGTVVELIAGHTSLTIGFLVSFVTSLCLFYGYNSLRPNFYWPHIVLNTLSIIYGLIIYSIYTFAALSYLGKGRKEPDETFKNGSAEAWGAVIVGMFVVCGSFIQFYFVRVVYRARLYIIDVLLNPNIQRVPHFHAASATTTNVVSDIL
ncbi:hypothetical protein M3Y98_00861300 [Aphelenchoides besseyi]|nr:hypothetical protein M3Y98_00861300 [Aphelenchoides besseyi]KAI6211182.1 hypothetical protein M3Y96_00406700 [Aphelenchoides besseyi]